MVVVRLIKSYYRVIASKHRQADTGILEQLLDSRTLGEAFITPLKLRVLNREALMVIFLWALSPLGGQASLRVVDTVHRPNTTDELFTYINYDTKYLMITGSDSWKDDIDVVKAIFTTSLLSSPDIRQSPYDAWDNFKVPLIERGEQPLNTSSWMSVQELGYPDDAFYSSLVGIPVGSVTDSKNPPDLYGTDTNYTLSTHTKYMNLSCGELNLNSTIEDNRSALSDELDWTVAESSTGLLIRTDNRSRNEHDARVVYFQAQNAKKNAVSTTCNLTTTLVEVKSSSFGTAWQADSIRYSGQDSQSPLDRSKNVSDSFFMDFVNATVPQQQSTASAIEWYLYNPTDAFNVSHSGHYPNYSTVSSQDFSTRLTQLINTYYLASIAPAAVSGDSNVRDWKEDYRYNYTNSTGQVTRSNTFIRCHYQWLTVMVFASAVMMVSGLACMVITILDPESSTLSREQHESDAELSDLVAQRISSGPSGFDF